jgi:hypothetical protein
MKRSILIGLIVLGTAVAACAPEGVRQRGGDPAADIGNHGFPVQMHGDVDPVRHIYYQMPLVGKGIQTSGSAGAIHPRP